MPRTSELRTNFTAGELSGLVDARTQFSRYFNGSSVLENWVVLPQGPVFRRKGFKFLAETKDSSKKSRLVPFEFSSVQTYALEMGDNYMRFFSGQGVVLDAMSATLEISTPYSEDEIFDIKFVQDGDVMYFAHPLHPIQKLTRLAFNDFTLSPVSLIKGPYLDPNIISTETCTITGGAPWTEGSTLTLNATGHTPFTTEHVGGLWKLEQGTDIAHLKITGFTSSSSVTVVAQNDIPVSLQNTAKFTWSEGEFSDARSYPSAISFHEQRLVLGGSIDAPQKIFFSKTNADYENFEKGTEDDDAFNVKIASQRGDPIRWLFSDDVLFVGTANGVFRIKNSNNNAALSITDIDVKKHISYGCSDIQPEIVGSTPIYIQKGDNKARDIGFSVQSSKYSANDLTVDSEQVIESGISEIDYQQDPLSSLWAVRNDGQIARLTLETDQEVQAWSRFTTQGLFESVAVVNGADDNDEIYAIVNRDGGRFVEIQEPNYLVDNLNRFFVDSGLTYSGIRSATITLSGSMASFVLLTEDEKVLLTEDGEVLITESVDIIISSDVPIFTADDVGNEIHQLNGKGRALITTFLDTQNIFVEIIEVFDSLTLTTGQWAVATKNIEGLSHLEGEEVQICSDGATEPSQIVNSGAISINNAGSIIHVGLGYTSKQKNMPLEASSLAQVIGSSQHKTMRIDTAIISFQDTNGGQIISNDDNLIISARSLFDNQNETPPLFAGDEEIIIAGNWGSDAQIEVIQSDPQPMTLKSITYKATINDK